MSHILICEDSRGHVADIRERLETPGSTHTIRVVQDLKRALEQFDILLKEFPGEKIHLILDGCWATQNAGFEDRAEVLVDSFDVELLSQEQVGLLFLRLLQEKYSPEVLQNVSFIINTGSTEVQSRMVEVSREIGDRIAVTGKKSRDILEAIQYFDN